MASPSGSFQPKPGGFTAINADPSSTFRPTFRRVRCSKTPLDDTESCASEYEDYEATDPPSDGEGQDDSAPLVSSERPKVPVDAIEAMYEDGSIEREAVSDRNKNAAEEMDVGSNAFQLPVLPTSDIPASGPARISTATPTVQTSRRSPLSIYAVGRLVRQDDRSSCASKTVSENEIEPDNQQRSRPPEAISLLSSPDSSPKIQPKELKAEIGMPDASPEDAYEELSLDDEDLRDTFEAMQEGLNIPPSPMRPCMSSLVHSTPARSNFSVPAPITPLPSRHCAASKNRDQLPTPPDSSAATARSESFEPKDSPDWHRRSFPDRVPLYSQIPGLTRHQFLRVFPRTADAVSQGQQLASDAPNAVLIIYGRLISARRVGSSQYSEVEDILDSSAPRIRTIWSSFLGRPILEPAADDLLQVCAGGAHKFVEIMGCFRAEDEEWTFHARTMCEIGLQDMRNVAYVHELK